MYNIQLDEMITPYSIGATNELYGVEGGWRKTSDRNGSALPLLVVGKKVGTELHQASVHLQLFSRRHHLTFQPQLLTQISRALPNTSATMVKLTEVEDEHFAQEKPQASKHNVLLASDDEDDDYTDTGQSPTTTCLRYQVS
jgi:hypothetical protein